MDRLERHSDPLALVVVANDSLAKTSCVDRAAAWASAPTSGRNFSKGPHGSLRQPEKPNSDGDGSRLQQTQAVACRWGEQRLAARTEAISRIPAVSCGMPSPGNLPTNLLKCSSSVPTGPQLGLPPAKTFIQPSSSAEKLRRHCQCFFEKIRSQPLPSLSNSPGSMHQFTLRVGPPLEPRQVVRLPLKRLCSLCRMFKW